MYRDTACFVKNKKKDRKISLKTLMSKPDGPIVGKVIFFYRFIFLVKSKKTPLFQPRVVKMPLMATRLTSDQFQKGLGVASPFYSKSFRETGPQNTVMQKIYLFS